MANGDGMEIEEPVATGWGRQNMIFWRWMSDYSMFIVLRIWNWRHKTTIPWVDQQQQQSSSGVMMSAGQSDLFKLFKEDPTQPEAILTEGAVGRRRRKTNRISLVSCVSYPGSATMTIRPEGKD